MRFEIIGDTETNGLGDYDYTMLVEKIVIVGSYTEDGDELSFMIVDENEDTDKNNELVERLFDKHRADIITMITD